MTIAVRRAHLFAARIMVGVALAFVLSDVAEGCECGPPSPCQALSSADAIVVALVRDISWVDTPDGHGMTVVVTLAVERSFVGDASSVVLKSRFTSCSFPFRTGERYMVYARQNDDGSYAASFCSGTKLLAEAGEDLTFLTALPPAGTGGSVTGTVERSRSDIREGRGNDKRTAAAGIALTISGPNGVVRKLVTDREGRFRISGLPAGEYSVAVNELHGFRPTGDLRVRVADRGCATIAVRLVSNARAEPARRPPNLPWSHS